MLRTNTLQVTLLSVACAASLLAQDSPRPATASFDVAAAEQGPASEARTPYNDPPPPPPGAAIPATLSLKSGAFVTIRVNQWLSSDRNQAGDTFYATLAEPLIVDGIVVARRGSTVMGRVSEAKKAGRVEGLSRLGLQLTNISLVDGQQVSVQSQVIDRNGNSSVGRDAAAIGTTTGMGAAIGASAAGGPGAAIGAGAGAVASTLGVLLTRGRPTEIYPETMLTFRLEGPVEISTAHAAGAFHYADQEDYGTGNQPARVASQRVPRPMGVGPGYPPPYPYYSPYYYGGGFSVVVGPRYYGGWGHFRRW